jgi:hypothetical protein
MNLEVPLSLFVPSCKKKKKRASAYMSVVLGILKTKKMIRFDQIGASCLITIIFIKGHVGHVIMGLIFHD